LAPNKNSSDLDPLKESFRNESRIFLATGIIGENFGRRKRAVIEYAFEFPSEWDHKLFHVYFVCNPIGNKTMCWRIPQNGFPSMDVVMEWTCYKVIWISKWQIAKFWRYGTI